MNDGKKNRVKRSLENVKQELSDLKSKNPDGNYDELEQMLDKMNSILDNEYKESATKLLLKLLLFLILTYLTSTICVVIVFGFARSLLNPIPPLHYITIVPLTSLALFIGLRIMVFISNKATINSLFAMFIFCIIYILGLSFLDDLCFHICSSLGNSILMTSALFIIATIVDLFITQKIYLKL
ncbi:MAG: hypothetical protein K2J85_07370 [Anaeroplasmataceae bacterium]|nr:hypothetical protein [Anaeroplasmataceae bacterium]